MLKLKASFFLTVKLLSCSCVIASKFASSSSLYPLHICLSIHVMEKHWLTSISYLAQKRFCGLVVFKHALDTEYIPCIFALLLVSVLHRTLVIPLSLSRLLFSSEPVLLGCCCPFFSYSSRTQSGSRDKQKACAF